MKQILPDEPAMAVMRPPTEAQAVTDRGGEANLETAKSDGKLARPQFVLGVFHDGDAMREAVACLLGSDLHHSQLLLVARTPPASVSIPITSASVKRCHLDLESRNEDLLRHAIAAAPAFLPLWESMRANGGNGDGTYPRIYTQLIQHLATGANILIARMHREEQQRRIARALLDCRCDFLLTHEVSIRCD